MAFRKHVLISVVLLAISGILFGCGDSTVAPKITTDAPIVAPANVTAEMLANGDVRIDWDASTQPTLRGYNVYRLDIENSQIGKLNSTELAVNDYTDTSAGYNIVYEYRVTAVSNKGIESGYTAVVIELSDNSTKKDPQRNEE